MLDRPHLGLDQTVSILRAAGETTRLRLLALLMRGDLNVTDLIEILGQSQPRISRHLRLLTEAGLLQRHQEGAWAYFRAAEDGAASAVLDCVLRGLDNRDPQMLRDQERLAAVRQRRAAQADAYFAANAAQWDALRSLHVDESRVEEAMLEIVGNRHVRAMLDLGTGTGRLLELFAPIYQRAIGVDANRDMLALARAKLDAAGLHRVQVRQGDIFMLPTPPDHFDLVTLHQVLHFLDDPGGAIREAARALAPGGRMLIVDFAPHEHEFLRERHLHRRLGFSHEQMADWIGLAGLEMRKTVDLAPDGNAQGEGGGRLTVSIWLAQDRRLLLAELEEGASADASRGTA